MTDKKPPQNPEFMAALGALMSRHSLTDDSGAALLGVPVFTFRKWTTGTRSPSAAAVRLVDVLCTLEALAPAVFDALMPAPAAAPVAQVDPQAMQSPKRKRKMEKDPL